MYYIYMFKPTTNLNNKIKGVEDVETPSFASSPCCLHELDWDETAMDDEQPSGDGADSTFLIETDDQSPADD